MKKNTIIVTALLTVMLFGGCGNNNNAQESDSAINAVAEEMHRSHQKMYRNHYRKSRRKIYLKVMK